MKTKSRPFFLSEGGITKLSASGIIIDAKRKLVLTSGILISPFIEKTTSKRIFQNEILYEDLDLQCGTKIDVQINQHISCSARVIAFVRSEASDKCVQVDQTYLLTFCRGLSPNTRR